MNIDKSTNHSKIAGDFGESLVLYWLSKHGFECVLVDHTGIDIIAKNPHTGELMGISVKNRSQTEKARGRELQIEKRNFPKALAACEAFNCVPYFAIVVDGGDTIQVFIVTLEYIQELHKMKDYGLDWKMGKKALAKYESDDQIMTFELQTETKRWWGG